MGTDPTIVIAYRDMGDEARRSAFSYVLDWYGPLGWEIVWEQGSDDATFTRASALNAAIRRASGDVIVQVDPDSLVPLDKVRRAALWAGQRPGLVVCHDRYLYLTREATAEVYGGRDPFTCGPDDCDEWGMRSSGNVVAFSRATWTWAGGFDERFGLRAGDDAAFRYAAESLAGDTRRTINDMVHLNHPRLTQYEPGGAEYAGQFALLAEYRDASARGPEAVRALVKARRS